MVEGIGGRKGEINLDRKAFLVIHPTQSTGFTIAIIAESLGISD